MEAARLKEEQLESLRVLGLAVLLLSACVTERLGAPIEEAHRAPITSPQQTRELCLGDRTFRIGSGVYDITGPAAQLGMAGYVEVSQKAAGIHTRLRSRAFIIESPCNGKRVVFVSADLQGISQAVKRKVVRRLLAAYPDSLYRDENVLLSATHNHSGPGGFSHHALYNLSILGFNPQNFDAIVDGIVKSIVKAHRSMTYGEIGIASGELLRASINRSPIAYLENPPEERLGVDDTDKIMTVLRLEAPEREVGMISWFAVHGTSMGNTNRLISGDNKGYASYLFEKKKNTRYDAPQTFVAAFAQSNEGDVSPNICNTDIPGADSIPKRSPRDVLPKDCLGGDNGGGTDDFESTRISGKKQFRRALELYEHRPMQLLSGGVDYRHIYVRMDEVILPDSAGHARRTCKPVYGPAVLAGTPDGRGPWLEGRNSMACERAPWGHQLACLGRDEWDCQGLKPRLLGRQPPGHMEIAGVFEAALENIVLRLFEAVGHPLIPEILPVQILRIGDLAILGVPFEVTTMAGRRLRNTVLTELQPVGVKWVVLAGLANAFASYLATREEYARQFYEGASTLFGQWTLDALRHVVAGVAEALREGVELPPGPTPPDLSLAQMDFQTGVVKDDTPWSIEFGDVFQNHDAKASYTVGDTVTVTFWSGHPKNNLRTQETFLKVQRRVGNSWVTEANDWDWETRYRWKRSRCLSCSLATIQWIIPPKTLPGVYRIRHFGDWKPLAARARPFVGTSREFRVSSD